MEITGENVEDIDQTKTVIRMIDENQNFKAVSLQCREIPNVANLTVFSVNQYGARAYREAFLEFLNNTYPEFFDENDDLDEIKQAANEKAENETNAFLKSMCGEYVQPCLEFPFNAAEL